MLKSFLLVGIGGMIGSMLRYLVAVSIRPGSFPYATLAVNISGAFVIGAVMGLCLRNEAWNGNWRLFIATGICGGFTTFSAFSLECIQLLQQHRYGAMAAYISLSVILGLAATFAGIQIMRAV